jgi:hypothetical protein
MISLARMQERLVLKKVYKSYDIRIFKTRPYILIILLLTYFYQGEIGNLVPQLYPEGQVRPSTFKLANIVPQLLF